MESNTTPDSNRFQTEAKPLNGCVKIVALAKKQ
jgi:hypothetical protein